MRRPLLPVVLLLLAACGSSAGASPCDRPAAPATGPVLLQEGSGALTVRTDGPCAVVAAFTGAPTDRVASYLARLEAAGDGLRLVVDPLDQDGQSIASLPTGRSSGEFRTAGAELDEPLAGRRVVDEDDEPLLVLDGDRLLRPGRLPAGWSAGQERGRAGPYLWQHGIAGPGRGTGATLLQGGREAGRMLDGEGYREVDAPQVRGEPGVLAVSDLGTWTLTWTEDDRGFLLQLRGAVDAPGALLVELADGLV